MNMQAQSHRSDPRILDRRTLEQDHRRLAALLRPGLRVLDAGCGTGAITAGIAGAVGPSGFVVGLDREASFLEIARRDRGGMANLRFVEGDVASPPFLAQFDIVNAARTLQWIGEPARAVAGMKQAARAGGLVVALDYNHTGNAWAPDPPAAFRTFYEALLAWRETHHWDNQMGDHLPELFRAAGLVDVETHRSDEIAERGRPGFDEVALLWSEVIEKLREPLTREGFLSASALDEAGESYAAWARTGLVRQTLSLRTVIGKVA
jgi:SAM-dependent methyltransferase